MPKFKVGDVVRIKDLAHPDGYLSPGECATISEVWEDVAIFYKYPHQTKENCGTDSRYWFSEMELVSQDSGLRDAIAALPGLENADLVWNHVTDPARFLERYGEVLSDLLTYYRRKEEKLDALKSALWVINNA